MDDARSWFAATDQSFDLIQMSMIDTWAATGAGAFSLSENGLYTLEGWRAFTSRLTDHGVFTVSRWYNPGDVNESGRMIALALATMMDAGAADPRAHVFVARGRAHRDAGAVEARVHAGATGRCCERQRRDLDSTCSSIPERNPRPPCCARWCTLEIAIDLDRAASTEALDLTVPTDNRPFFFNQLRFRHIPSMLLGDGAQRSRRKECCAETSSPRSSLVLILAIAAIAVVCTIVLPLRGAARSASRSLIGAGTAYFALIGIGFMFAEISLLQYFGIFLGHPIYAMGVCLFSLILSTGIGSLVSGAIPLNTRRPHHACGDCWSASL